MRNSSGIYCTPKQNKTKRKTIVNSHGDKFLCFTVRLFVSLKHSQSVQSNSSPSPLVRLLMDTLEESVNSHRNASLDIFIITFFLLQLFRTMTQQPLAAPCQHWIFKRTRHLNPTDLKITAIFA